MTQSRQGTRRLSVGAGGTCGKLTRGPVVAIAGTIGDTEQIQEHFDKVVSVVGELITLEAALKDPVETLRQRVAEFWE
jgi:hypothetical protein